MSHKIMHRAKGDEERSRTEEIEQQKTERERARVSTISPPPLTTTHTQSQSYAHNDTHTNTHLENGSLVSAQSLFTYRSAYTSSSTNHSCVRPIKVNDIIKSTNSVKSTISITYFKSIQIAYNQLGKYPWEA